MKRVGACHKESGCWEENPKIFVGFWCSRHSGCALAYGMWRRGQGCHSKSLSLQSIRLSTTIQKKMVLSQGRVSLEQRLGTALQTAILLISLSFSAVSRFRLTWPLTYTISHTHTSRLPRLSSPGLGSLLNHLAEHCVVYWANWIPQYQNQKMLSSISWRQLIARDMAK